MAQDQGAENGGSAENAVQDHPILSKPLRTSPSPPPPAEAAAKAAEAGTKPTDSASSTTIESTAAAQPADEDQRAIQGDRVQDGEGRNAKQDLERTGAPEGPRAEASMYGAPPPKVASANTRDAEASGPGKPPATGVHVKAPASHQAGPARQIRAQAQQQGPAQQLSAAGTPSRSQASAMQAPGSQVNRPPAPGFSSQPARPPPFLKTHITNIVRTKHPARGTPDVQVKFEAHTNLPTMRRSFYPAVERNIMDMALLVLSLSLSLPHLIIPAVPHPPSSLLVGPATSNHEPPSPAERQFHRALTAFFSRLFSHPAVMHHASTASFIDSDFTYHPLLPPVGPGAAPGARRRLETAIAAARSGQAALGGKLHIDVGSGLGLPNGVLGTTLSTSSGSGSGGGPLSFLGFGKSNGGGGAGGGGGVNGGGGSSSSAATSYKNVFTTLHASSSAHSGNVTAVGAGGHDEHEDLVAARAEVTRLELQFQKAAEGSERREAARVAVANATHALNSRLLAFGSLEETRPIAKREGLPAMLEVTAAALQEALGWEEGLASHNVISLLHPVLYQSDNARQAKEALMNRNVAVEDHWEAQKAVINRKREAEVLRAQGSAAAGKGIYGYRERVDAKVEELEEARRRESVLGSHVHELSNALRTSLQQHSKAVHADLQSTLAEHARGNLFYHERYLEALQALQESLVTGDAMSGKRPVPAYRRGHADRDVESEATHVGVDGGPTEAAAAESTSAKPAPTPQRQRSSTDVDGDQRVKAADAAVLPSQAAAEDTPTPKPSSPEDRSTLPTTHHDDKSAGADPSRQPVWAADDARTSTADQEAPAVVPPNVKVANPSPSPPPPTTPAAAVASAGGGNGFVSTGLSRGGGGVATPASLMTQSMFLPGRGSAAAGAARPNPWARINDDDDDDDATPGEAAAPPPPRPSGLPETEAPAPWGSASMINTGSAGGAPAGGVGGGVAGGGGAWAGRRSRLSASEAARTLAGRF